MIKELRKAKGAGYRAGRAGEVSHMRHVGEHEGRKLYAVHPGALNPYRDARGLRGLLCRRWWEAARLEGLRERVMRRDNWGTLSGGLA